MDSCRLALVGNTRYRLREGTNTRLDIVARTTAGDVEFTVAVPPTAAALLGDSEA